jgi:membrane associated rhomboid family serine protease
MGIYERSYYREENELDLRPNWDQRSAVSMLIIINVVVFVANLFLSKSIVGNYQGAVNEFLILSATDATHPLQWWHTFTYAFCHDALAPFPSHLLMNMLGLYFMGRSVEDKYGRREFYRIYIAALLICGIVWLIKAYVYQSDGTISRVLGASGAVLCITMLFVFNFPTSRVYFYVVPMPAWVLGIIIALSNFGASSSSDVSTDVHLTGILVAGVYFYFGLSFRFLEDLQGTWRRMLRRLTGPKLKIHDDSSSGSANAIDEADRILAKIHESGQESLTSKEKKFLESYSRSVRAKKDLIE